MTNIDYVTTHAAAVLCLSKMDNDERYGEFGAALDLHAANYRDVINGRMTDEGENDHFFRQTERFFRCHGLLVERS